MDNAGNRPCLGTLNRMSSVVRKKGLDDGSSDTKKISGKGLGRLEEIPFIMAYRKEADTKRVFSGAYK
ncbi:hypothetical protein GOP47_0030625 [Adiantum capillus-veneris]|nr:hypothetical protein GOP47_0030625 [Adiantum capillus-veneris]